MRFAQLVCAVHIQGHTAVQHQRPFAKSLLGMLVIWQLLFTLKSAGVVTREKTLQKYLAARLYPAAHDVCMKGALVEV